MRAWGSGPCLRAAAGQTGTFAKHPTACPRPGVSYCYCGSLPTSLQGCCLLGNESHLTERLRNPPGDAWVLAQKEGDVCAANTKCLTWGLCWGSAHAMLTPVSRGCLAHPAPSGTAFSLSSFFPPPLEPVLTHEQQGQRVGPHHQQGQTPSLSSSQMGLTLPQQPGEHVGGSHPVEKRVSFPKPIALQ